MLPCILCWCFTAPRSGAEIVDHLNPRWEGASWVANRLQTPGLVYQRALFPLVTQGPARLRVPEGAFVLRLSVFIQETVGEAPVLVLWGRVADAKPAPLATLYLRNGRLLWVCPDNPKGDSLFDTKIPVELMNDSMPAGLWLTVDTLVNPAAYQQTFGWNRTINAPEDPARRKRTGPLLMARQLSEAPWEIDHFELPKLDKLWIGQLELLNPETPTQTINLNVARVVNK